MNEWDRASPLYVGPSKVLVPGVWRDLVELDGVIARHMLLAHYRAERGFTGGPVLCFW